MSKPVISSAADAELFQSHGSRIEAFFNLDDFVKRLINPMIQASAVDAKTQTAVVFDDGSFDNTDVFGLLYGSKALGFMTLLATNKERQVNEVLATYPVADGETHRAHIDEVMVWDNQICATIRCTIGDYSLAFFATDFYLNKERYSESEMLDINLAAFACAAEEADKGFSFEGQKAVDWLAKMGEKPTYNEDGSVQPVRFSTEDLVVYLDLESKAPDEAQFQSPAGPVENMSFVDVELYKTSIKIRGNDADFGVSLFLRKEFIPNLEEKMPIRGYSCMIGRIEE